MARAPSRRFGFVKLPGKAKRWRNEKQPRFPDRRNDLRSRDERTLAKPALRRADISKERYAKSVKSGALAYHPKTIRRLEALEFRRSVIDQYAPQMKPRERQLIYEWMRQRKSGVMHPASEEGGLNRRFKKLFAKYEATGNADALREMLGSEVRDTGAFSIAA